MNGPALQSAPLAAAHPDSGAPLLKLEKLTTVFPLRRGTVRAVTGLDLEVREGEVLGIVGESGSGKSMTLLSILGLVPYPGRIVEGKILYKGENLLEKSVRELRAIRGKEIAMIFQDPMTSLNPVFRAGEQVAESLRIHGLARSGGFFRLPGMARRSAEREQVLRIMEEVGIPSPDHRYDQYPHQFSGGMQQRMVIAIALACEPKLLLADEPTTALDVTIQAQIVELLKRINETHRTSAIFVTHDLALAAEFCHRIAVMYAGRIVEIGSTEAVMHDPKHPYTQGLLRSIPRIGGARTKIQPIPGEVPEPIDLPPGCAFAPRCEKSRAECLAGEIALRPAQGREVRCVLY